ncbi:hypothetical protein M5X00_13140 [Paenibacillus alvei]|uniref:hypothetical protein n=1 Tax=Paenibacillus alvei TaxID=44250 RepID=UPI0002889137|nr:hypothetical protein [Paenibacillus alvei]EJW13802.1 hypothetical protein PAV_109p00320 [Paenibacillus alvei DSM 29]MCY9540530.1 hypothetical protein [Paenibacillus alvei]MCY9708264.1 hypothetical protein [Paenibacillus alvei]MCY9732939.1 hypothetical protein [Paenibacillus alvei]MCY9755185.1 hypothetical protein [Paenibacillus alvei]
MIINESRKGVVRILKVFWDWLNKEREIKNRELAYLLALIVSIGSLIAIALFLMYLVSQIKPLSE